MRLILTFALSAALAAGAVGTVAQAGEPASPERYWSKWLRAPVHLGPRPAYLVDKMAKGPLKRELKRCDLSNIKPSKFSIGHRGAPLQFPEHTRESYLAAARTGAGILECDVTFTKDGELVCRHSQCDLHTTTNILATPLANTCEQGFQPAEFDSGGNMTSPASAKCCTSGLTLEQFLSLKGKMDARDSAATTVEAYLGGTADFRTDLYATGGTLLSHKQSVKLFRRLGTKMTPELKGADREVGFGESGFTQETYAARMIQDYIDLGIHPRHVYPQSFNINDVLQWIDETPGYGKRAVFLDGNGQANSANNPPEVGDFTALLDQGVNIIAPPMPVLLTLDGGSKIVPSTYARNANTAGMKIISWTTERSGRIVEDVQNGSQGFYYGTTLAGLESDGDILTTIDVLARDVGIIGLFSDWPATTTFYANCVKH